LDCSYRHFDKTTAQNIVNNVDSKNILFLNISNSDLTSSDLKTFSLLHRLVKLKMANLDFCRIDFNVLCMDHLSRLTNLRSLEIPLLNPSSLHSGFLLTLTKLVSLDLSGWRITKNQLRNLSYLKNLRYLKLRSCILEGGLYNLNSLKILDFTGVATLKRDSHIEITSSFSNLTSLSELYLKDSFITDIGSICTLSQLEVLDISSVSETTISLLASHLTNLVSLGLHDCSSIDNDRSFNLLWERLLNLKYILLNEASLNSALPINRLNALRFLTLKSSTLSLSFLESLRGLENLWSFEVNMCNLLDTHYNIISNFTSLRTLVIKDDYLFQPTSISLHCLSKLTSLYKLTMKNLHCENISFLGKMGQLKSLGLVHLHPSIESFQSLSQLTNLESLYISTLVIDKNIISHMTNLQSLTVAKSVKLSNFIDFIKNLPRLEWLDVSRIYLSESDRSKIALEFPYLLINW